ncbi:glutamyl-tRNA synthetase [Halteromyces radiatus]|uniref:glutamyl-tRNA synthetase n=1 Tax=Halteromyces radiatus TaxID=101107 RepID=UPI002220D02E|nr:glutamyl-tRNA synthetase [Halteromyces radiatus]KAI8084447.1 glutamyl-tRNA synthetase [Halteromyces radiatus]
MVSFNLCYRFSTLPYRRFYQTVANTSLPPVRVRFAPSPTGQLHLGGLRTALYNYLLAKQTGGQFILRIEDTDQTRYVPGAVEKLISSLSWAGIYPDEGPPLEGGPYAPYFQSQRTEMYRQYSDTLIKNGHAYRCFCSPERLQKIRETRKKQGCVTSYDKHCSHLTSEEIQSYLDKKTPYTIRHNVPWQGMIEFQDHVHGKLQFQHTVLDDTILIKSDGFPTYHLANVVDDHQMKITHVLRGEEWISSTPKHILLYKAFGWTPPEFAHLPLLLNDNRTKLSKRSGDVHVEQYIKKGFLPEAVNNFVALLGWHPHQNTSNDNPKGQLSSEIERQDEILDMDQLIQQFSLDHLHRSGAVVDPAKLSWINKQHLLKRTQTTQGLQSLVKLLTPLIQEHLAESINYVEEYRLSPTYLSQVILTVKDRIRNVNDIPTLCIYYFLEPDYTTKDAMDLRKKLKTNVIDLLLDKSVTFNTLQKVNFEEGPTRIKQWIHETAESHKINGNHMMMALRYVMTGTKVGAGVAETMHTLGQITCIDRLEKFINENSSSK